jgi:lysine-specific demethylase 8
MNESRIDIPRLSACQPDFDFGAIRERQSPVILTGATNSWPAKKKWSLEYLSEILGDHEYMAEVGLPKDVPISYSLDDFQKKVRMDDFINTIRTSDSDRASYITNKSIDRFPGLASDLDFEQLLGMPVTQELTKMWIGTANTKSSLHFDPYENVLCQVVGRKRVYLVDPRSTSKLYQYASNIDKSRVDVELPDYEAFPKFRGVAVMEGLIEDGECLFIPKLWWHSVRSLDPSVSVNCFYGVRMGERELLPMMWAGGPRLVAAFVRDFLWSGLLRRPYRQRLYAAEPFGVWFYNQVRDFILRRVSKIFQR